MYGIADRKSKIENLHGTPAGGKLKISIRGSAKRVIRFLEMKNTIIKTKSTIYLTNLALRIVSIDTDRLNLSGRTKPISSWAAPKGQM
jgi:hypothetical protein